MNINIREIFTSDLDPNSADWWSIDKIDKINYNFRQVSQGGVRGPQGYIGIDGDAGAIGPQGSIGDDGADGAQGPQGLPGVSPWEYHPHNPTDVTKPGGYLFPKKHTSAVVQYTTTVMRIGISAGTSNYINPESYYGSVVKSNVRLSSPTLSTLETNLRLQYDTFYFDFMLNANTIDIGRVSNSNPGLQIVYKGETLINVTDNGTINAHEINTLIANVRKPATLNKKVNISGGLKYAKSSPYPITTTSVLVSLDNAGKTNWRDIRDVFPSFPIGTIISIRPDDFNSTNFHLNETITQSGVPLPILDVRYGRGKVGSEYEGWYLCNGLEWTDLGSNTTLTPNLNRFQYNIQGNGGLQPTVSQVATALRMLIAGYKIEFEAFETGGKYDPMFVTSSFKGNDEIYETFDATGTGYTLKPNIHIVYLGANDLIWQDTTP